MSGRNGSIRKAKSDTVCRFCGLLLNKGGMVRKFGAHGKTIYECVGHFQREPEPKMVVELKQTVAIDIRLTSKTGRTGLVTI